MARSRLAVYTTVYPAARQYLPNWYRSVLLQTDIQFDLFVGLDSIDEESVRSAIGARNGSINFIRGSGTQAQIRQSAIETLVREYDAVVFVDSDDLLYPTRVESARKTLETSDVSGCALRVIDDAGADLGITFGQTNGEPLGSMLPRYNVFGLSNTAYRSDVLAGCLPLPEGCQLIDWLLASRAWAAGARLKFDPVARMAYRQYSSNVARVLLPFSAEQILQATSRVIGHYRCALESERPINGAFGAALREAWERAATFQQSIGNPGTLKDYVDSLNRMAPRYVWWWCVAHPALEHLWRN
jgi:hypothetical protein